MVDDKQTHINGTLVSGVLRYSRGVQTLFSMVEFLFLGGIIMLTRYIFLKRRYMRKIRDAENVKENRK